MGFTVLMVRLKQCECALADGLLDDAYELARQPDMRAHRRGQQLAQELVAALVERGRHHLAAGRLLQAGADAQKAANLGGNLAEVAQLRAAIANAMHGQDRAAGQANQVLAAAQRTFEAGQLTVAEHLVDALESPNTKAEAFKQDVAARRLAVESAVKKASDALGGGNWQAAIDFLSPVKNAGTHDPGLRKVCDQICEQLMVQITAAFESGGLHVVSNLLASLDRLPVANAQSDIARHSVQQCHLAFEAIENGQPQQAQETLRRLGSMWPKAKWVAEAAEQAGEIAQRLSTLRSGPLSLATCAGTRDERQAARNAGAASPGAPALGWNGINGPVAGQRAPIGNTATGSFSLHVDGIGSFRIFTGSAVTLGPIASSRGVDVPLMLDPALPRLTIARSDEDYFLKSDRPVAVNEQPIANKLLSDGDRIGVGSRCRITFRRPVAASTSAVLELSGTRLSSSAIRQIVLMDREIVIGPGSASHIRADDLLSPIVLQLRGDTLLCRSMSPIAVDGKALGQSAEIPINASISVGPIRFVMAREQRT